MHTHQTEDSAKQDITMPFHCTIIKHSMIEALNQDKLLDLNEANNDFSFSKPLSNRCRLPRLNKKDDNEKSELRPALSPRRRIPVIRAEIECVAERDQLLQGEAEAAHREYAMHQRIQNARQQKSQFFVPVVSPRGSDTIFHDRYCAWEQTRLHDLMANTQTFVTGGSHDEVVFPEEHEGVFEMEL
jgi:hypothetical protein